MRALYDRMDALPPTLQMFMAGCSRELDEKRVRMCRRGLVMRNLLALSLGIRRTACWNLAPEIPNYDDPLQMMHLMFATFALVDYDDAVIRVRRPTADTFALLTSTLAGVTGVTRVDLGDPAVYAFDVAREGRPPLLALWHQRDPFDGEDEPPIRFERPWPHERSRAVDAFGAAHPCEVSGDRLRLPLSITPVFVGAE